VWGKKRRAWGYEKGHTLKSIQERGFLQKPESHVPEKGAEKTLGKRTEMGPYSKQGKTQRIGGGAVREKKQQTAANKRKTLERKKSLIMKEPFLLRIGRLKGGGGVNEKREVYREPQK